MIDGIENQKLQKIGFQIGKFTDFIRFFMEEVDKKT